MREMKFKGRLINSQNPDAEPLAVRIREFYFREEILPAAPELRSRYLLEKGALQVRSGELFQPDAPPAQNSCRALPRPSGEGQGFWIEMPAVEKVQFAVFQNKADATNKIDDRATLKDFKDLANKCLFISNFDRFEFVGRVTDLNGQNPEHVRITASYLYGELGNYPEYLSRLRTEVGNLQTTQPDLIAELISRIETLERDNLGLTSPKPDCPDSSDDNRNYVYNEMACIIGKDFPGTSLYQRRKRAWATFAFGELAPRLAEEMKLAGITSNKERAHFYAQILKEARGGFFKEGAGVLRNPTRLFYDKIFELNSDRLKRDASGRVLACDLYDSEFSTRAVKNYYDNKHWYDFLYRGRGMMQLTGLSNYATYFLWKEERRSGIQSVYRSNTNRTRDGKSNHSGIAAMEWEKVYGVNEARTFQTQANAYYQINPDPHGVFRTNPVDTATGYNHMEMTLEKLSNPCRDNFSLPTRPPGGAPFTNTDFVVDSAIYYWTKLKRSNLDLETASVKRVTTLVQGGSAASVLNDRINLFNYAEACFEELYGP